MANKFGYNYEKIPNPYNSFLQRTETSEHIKNVNKASEGSGNNIRSSFNVGENVIDGKSMSDLTINNWIRSNNYKPGKDGCSIDGKTGNVEFNKGLFRGTVTLTGAIGSLDDIDDGSSYGKVKTTQLSGGLIQLKEVSGDMDDVSNGSTYGKVALTNISAGNIVLKVNQDLSSQGISIKSSSSYPYVRLYPDTETGIDVKDDAGNTVFKASIGGTNVGDVQIGNYYGNQGILYDRDGDSGSPIIKYKNVQWSAVVNDDNNKPDDNANETEVVTQTTAPTASNYHRGDVWVDTSDNNRPHTLDEHGNWKETNWNQIRNDTDAPKNNADVTGSNQAKDIVNLPDTPSGVSGLFADDAHLGFHDGTNWKSYIGSNGDFKFEGNTNNYIEWSSSLGTLNVNGSITIQNASGVRTDINVEDGADVTADHANEINYRQSTAPPHKEGRLWYDTDTKVLKRSTGVAWEEAGTSTSADEIIYKGDVAPSELKDGILWYDTSEDTLKRYDNSTSSWDKTADITSVWQAFSTEADIDVLSTTNAPAESGADETINHSDEIVYRGTTAPNHQDGRLWYDTSVNQFKRSDGASWEVVGDETALKETFSSESDINVLNTTNAPNESGADVTGSNTAKDSNKVQGYTIIDGGLIDAGFITADRINTGTLTVDSSNVGIKVNSGGDMNFWSSSTNSTVSRISFDDADTTTNDGWIMRYSPFTGVGYSEGALQFIPMPDNTNSDVWIGNGVNGAGLLVYGSSTFYYNLDVSDILSANGKFKLPVGNNLY